jgi:hypothetical protein
MGVDAISVFNNRPAATGQRAGYLPRLLVGRLDRIGVEIRRLIARTGAER